MKRLFLMTLSAILSVSALLVTGCAREELPDNRETDYGYVQFKLYKEVSYGNVTKASGDYLLDELSQAGKINIMLTNSEGRTISQTLTLSAADNEAAEFGLRSAKLRLLKGDYEVVSYALYDNLDNQIGNGNRTVVAKPLTIIPGGMEVFDLTADVAPRGMIRFNLVKDLSGLDPVPALRDRRDNGYTFDEISSLDITLVDVNEQTQVVSFTGIPVTFSIHFSGDEHYKGEDNKAGNQTSSSQADSIVYAPAGNYKILSYRLYDSDDLLLEDQDFTNSLEDQATVIEVTDNELTEADVPVTLVMADGYMRDYYALREIWLALDGPNWSYEGQTWPRGTNWNFDKDPDLWGDQPGVQIHDNGRVASIDLSGFGIKGEVPGAIGQLTDLVQLSFGNHNETRRYHSQSASAAAQPLYPVKGTAEDKALWRQNRYKDFGKYVCPTEPISPVCALALRMNGKTSPAASYYDNMSLDEISRMAASRAVPTVDQVRPYDMNLGTMTNGLTGISAEIRNLTRLESLSIANSPITKEGFPGADAFSPLTALTDLEIYNCKNLETLPEGIASLPSLITVNLSTNGFTEQGSYDALDDLASGSSQDVIQILYFLQNKLATLPVSVGEMASLGMLNVMQNNIQGDLPALGSNFAPQELSFDDNLIESVPENFCSLEALTSFTISYNELTEFPNFFSSDESNIIMSTINVAHNNITKLPDAGTFHGVRVNTLTLTGNPIDVFPAELAATNSFVEVLTMQSCGMKSFPEENCFNGENSDYLTTLDLQYNNLTDIPDYFSARTLPYISGMDVSYNAFEEFPLEPLNILRMTAFGIRSQRDAEGERCLSDWPEGLSTHTGLRGFYIGSNDLRLINDDISYLIFYLDISDNPNIIFDATDVCSAWQAGQYFLYYDRTQDIIGCDAMLD